MKLSIIIVSWNTRELLDACLASVYKYAPVCPFDIWVVDNVSTDDSVAMVQEKYPQVQLVENSENVGFARANNQAIALSQGEYVLLLNPDTVVKPEALTTLIEFMATHSDAGAAGSRLLNPDESLQPSCHPSPTLAREMWRLLHLDKLRLYGRYNMYTWPTDTAREVDVIQGAALILRRSILDQIGLLDEGYFIYSEEVDLCYRLQKADWRLYWIPQSKVIHYGGQSTRQVAREMFLRLYQGKLIYFRKHYGQMAGSMYKLILFIASLFRLAMAPFAWLEKQPQRQEHLDLAGNYWQLILALPTLERR